MATRGLIGVVRSRHAWPRAVRWLVATALSTLLAACGGSSAQVTNTDTASYQTLVDAGAHLLRQGNLQAAEQLFRQAIAKESGPSVAHYDLGVVYQQLGDRADALRQYNRALISDSDYVPALYNSAILFSMKNPALAMFYYRRAIQLQPDSPTALLNLGLLESRNRGLRRRALTDLKRAVRLDPALRARIPAGLLARLRKAGA